MTGEVRITQAVVEVTGTPVPKARITQAVVEVTGTPVPVARLTQMVIEVVSPTYRRRGAYVVPVNTRRYLPPIPA